MVSHYFEHDAQRDVEAIIALFSGDATVVDEAKRVGKAEIRAWQLGAASKYEYDTEVFSGEALGADRYLVTGRLTGNFPGAHRRPALGLHPGRRSDQPAGDRALNPRRESRDVTSMSVYVGEHATYFHPVGLAGVEALHARFVRHAYPPHSHPTWTVAVIERGAARFSVDASDHRADRGELFVLEPEAVHTGMAAVSGEVAVQGAVSRPAAVRSVG